MAEWPLSAISFVVWKIILECLKRAISFGYAIVKKSAGSSFKRVHKLFEKRQIVRWKSVDAKAQFVNFGGTTYAFGELCGCQFGDIDF
ncbi:hypothetical protein ABENE_08055 [Asticcacaulis benevestitus DSM 16100 = ATCC BAA-896]|uniref:Uncharacterized protein n=1 Tax=Asticcacaulis benevestitus DSM 16100 = ATCC BAA-896 TaxID=1121022 RepID=V4PW55_9CAUL|nr:hypothetical protein ABENE_08055 [Asticcacaulis benevestitus DSM 16100 = ATCC BAA-896]